MENKHRVVVILGSNINKEHNLPAAVHLLRDAANVSKVSTVYETTAVGTHERQPSYFNAAVLLMTGQSPAELKDGLLTSIERALGRRRTTDKFAPRTIDLDIALFDDEVIDYIPADGRVRHIPDPDLLRFAHCAAPVAELLPRATHPETGEPLQTIAERLLAALGDSDDSFRPRPDIYLYSVE